MTPPQNQVTTGTVVVLSETTTADAVVSEQVTTAQVVVSGSGPISSHTHPHTSTVSTPDQPARTTSDSAFTKLLLALRELDTRNESTPCQTPGIDHLWTSDDAEDREAACHRCQSCPLLAECATYATTAVEKHHVWAGIDMSPKPKKPRAAE